MELESKRDLSPDGGTADHVDNGLKAVASVPDADIETIARPGSGHGHVRRRERARQVGR